MCFGFWIYKNVFFFLTPKSITWCEVRSSCNWLPNFEWRCRFCNFCALLKYLILHPLCNLLISQPNKSSTMAELSSAVLFLFNHPVYETWIHQNRDVHVFFNATLVGRIVAKSFPCSALEICFRNIKIELGTWMEESVLLRIGRKELVEENTSIPGSRPEKRTLIIVFQPPK